MFVASFEAGGQAQMAIIIYSGPKTWSGVDQCIGQSPAAVDPETCGLKTITHFTDDYKKVRQLLLGAEWPEGSTLTSLALMKAKAELQLGRKDARGVVIVMTDG